MKINRSQNRSSFPGQSHHKSPVPRLHHACHASFTIRHDFVTLPSRLRDTTVTTSRLRQACLMPPSDTLTPTPRIRLTSDPPQSHLRHAKDVCKASFPPHHDFLRLSLASHGCHVSVHPQSRLTHTTYRSVTFLYSFSLRLRQVRLVKESYSFCPYNFFIVVRNLHYTFRCYS